jgi:hypothetical protein
VQRAGVRPKGGKVKIKQASLNVHKQGKFLTLCLYFPTDVDFSLARVPAPEPPRAQVPGPTLLVAETPQKPVRTAHREVSITGASFIQRLQESQAQSQRRVSMDKSGLEEFMVSSPERLRDDFNFGDMVLETPKK